MSVTAAGFFDRGHIETAQLGKLRALLAAIAPANPFYSARLEAARIGADLESLDQFRARVPFTFKQELIDDQRRYPPYGSNLTYPEERYTRISQTSATTGKPLRWLDTPQSWAWMAGNWMHVFRSAGVTPQDRIFFAFSFGPFIGFWLAFESAARLGCLAIPGGGLRSSARLQTMIDNRATVLCATPTYAIRLAEVAAEEGIDLATTKIRMLVVAGEPGGSIPGTRTHIEKLWHGARVVDHHGMTETGPVTYACPKRPDVLHVIESGYIAEIIDPASGRAVPEGTRGELVLTNLGRVGSPVLRLRTGDMVEQVPASPCACGSYEMALAGGILGRSDDMVVVRGVNVYPSAVENILRGFGVAEYRVEVQAQRTLAELSIQVELSREHDESAGVAERLEAALSSALSLRIPVTVVPSGTLPRFEMKAQRWVRV